MKQKLKSLFKIYVGGLIIRILNIKLFNKHLFINRYTIKLPGINRLINRINTLNLYAYTKKKIQKDYRKWFNNNYPKKLQLDQQIIEQQNLKNRPLISVILPTYNTNPLHLKECINSVLRQTYDNWELCIADDASTDKIVREIIESYSEKDSRIRYVFRETNGHICAASNSALELSKGEFVALLDHDDFLWPNALFEVAKSINMHPDADFIYSDEDKLDQHGKEHIEPFFKPDWSFEFLRSINYITHFAVLKKDLVNKLGGFRTGYEGAQDWDLFLRVSQVSDKIYHIPTVLYSWRKSATSTAQTPTAKDYAYVNQKKALEDDVKRRGLEADIEWQIPFFMWRVSYRVKNNPLISIVIPTKDLPYLISQCLSSIKEKTTYKNFEVIIVDTGSTEKRVWSIYDDYKDLGVGCEVIKWNKPFNFASVCNFGADHAKGKYLLFLNNDTEVITPNWLEEMVGYAEQESIGAVGCKLYYPDGKLQHAGIILGVGGRDGTPGIAGHFFPAYIDNPPQSPLQPINIGGARDFAAVTAACVMINSKKFKEVRGFDSKFRIAFNDVDLCLKLLKQGWRNVYLPQVTLFHHESISVGKPGSKQRSQDVFKKEIDLMLTKWRPLIKNDPYYHPEFRRDIANATLKVN